MTSTLYGVGTCGSSGCSAHSAKASSATLPPCASCQFSHPTRLQPTTPLPLPTPLLPPLRHGCHSRGTGGRCGPGGRRHRRGSRRSDGGCQRQLSCRRRRLRRARGRRDCSGGARLRGVGNRARWRGALAALSVAVAALFCSPSRSPCAQGLEEVRSIRVPQHRYTPLRDNWETIMMPLVEHMKLQVRFNPKRRSVELKVRLAETLAKRNAAHPPAHGAEL